MYLTEELFKEVLHLPYHKHGFRNLKILSGYASSSFLNHVIEKFPDIKIELWIGMAGKDGINMWDHSEFKRLANDTGRVRVYYYTDSPCNHSKVYHWFSEGILEESTTFIGSANFSWNGFRDQKELMAETNFENIQSVFEGYSYIECIDDNAEQQIKLHTFRENLKTPSFNIENEENFTADLTALDYVDLSLYIEKSNTIQEKSGLNWGQRPGRERNQAYIPVPTPFNRKHPNFFPPTKEEFTLLADDGESFICVMAQDNRKAIETKNNSVLGKYFRKRLGVPLGNKVEVNDLKSYGRTSVRIYKINNEIYYMDFKNPQDFREASI